MIKDVAKAIVSEGLKLGAEDVAGIIRRSIKKMVRFTNNKVTVIKEWREVRADFYLGYKRRVLTGSLSKVDLDTIRKAFSDLSKVAKYVTPLDEYVSLPRGPFEYGKIGEAFDDRVAKLEGLTDYVEEAINSALEEGARRVAGVLNVSVDEKFLATSSGIEAEDKATNISITVRAFLDKERSGQGVSCSRTLDKFDPSYAGRRAGEVASMCKKEVSADPGKYTVILDPLVVANLMGEIAYYGLSAYFVDAKLSFFTGLMGKKIAWEGVTLADDGRLRNGPASTLFDDEGIPTRRTVLIENGVLKSFLHNSRTASKFGVKTTGNAGWLIPRPWNIVLEPGDYKREELIGEVRKGIYITNNWYTRFQNLREGIFSSITRDGTFLIEGGEVKGMVRGFRISDRLPNLLLNVRGISKERELVEWWETIAPVLAPTLLVEGLNLTKATK